MLKTVIFDLDGVIVDSEPLMRFAFDRVYRDVVADDPAPIEDFLDHMGESFPRIMEKMGLPEALWEPYREICKENLDQIRIFPGSREVLTWVRTAGLKTGIMTGKDRERTLKLLTYFELGHLFDEVVASDQLLKPKPHPEGILLLLSRLNCTADETVMVGDSVNDIQAAQRAGVTAIAVTWGIKPERVRTLCQPDHLVHTWIELADLLLELHRSNGGIRYAD